MLKMWQNDPVLLHFPISYRLTGFEVLEAYAAVTVRWLSGRVHSGFVSKISALDEVRRFWMC